jgi:hypothetical protein
MPAANLRHDFHLPQPWLATFSIEFFVRLQTRSNEPALEFYSDRAYRAAK